ncbi:hypothetical protein GCM10010174_19220 [Kutzneria viridogrisea]|uniref:Fe2OG dioxygenase domain-containing protein n=1 Tax=Kutzneria albida DSM 43870 TaxID=1449976 RepID=W5WFW5_9PSEU|nr:hypothetical protein KALB_6141 [Kutzneria albida DSM 43870]
MLRGRVAGVVFRGVVPARTCALLAERFWASPARRARGTDAPGYYLGAYHYHKTTEDYLAETAEFRGALDAVLDMPDDPLTRLNQGLSEALAAEGVQFRLASHGGREASRAIMRSWHGQSEYALAPHEDLGQCTEPKQADFEIQRAAEHQIVALNMCLDNGAGGRLAVWNIRPDEASRHRLGLHYTGSPYPLDSLAGIEVAWLEVHPGDVYLFNGAHVHAVEPETSVETRRITLSGILGFIDENTVVSWT